jgi:hypothetical protein
VELLLVVPLELVVLLDVLELLDVETPPDPPEPVDAAACVVLPLPQPTTPTARRATARKVSMTTSYQTPRARGEAAS